MSTTSLDLLQKESFPLISVILPTYNRVRFLGDAIDSVLAQDYTPIELLVVDDGSTDGTGQLLESYGDRIVVLRQANAGVSAARNHGIRRASGQFIALLDSDDYWLPGKLTAQVDFFNTHPGAVLCQTEEIWMRNGVRVNPKARHRKLSGMIFEQSLPLCLISPSAAMLRRSLLDEVGLFDESLPACEDYDLWLRITWKYRADLIALPLIVKRGGHHDQLSRMAELDKYRIQAIVKVLQHAALSPDQFMAARAMLEQKCRIYAQGCRKRGRFAEAARYASLNRQFDIP